MVFFRLYISKVNIDLHLQILMVTSFLLLSSRCSASCRRWTAARAPGPKKARRSRRHKLWALTTSTLTERLTCPIAWLNPPSPASQPLALASFATRASASSRGSSWKSSEISHHGPPSISACHSLSAAALKALVLDQAGPSVLVQFRRI